MTSAPRASEAEPDGGSKRVPILVPIVFIVTGGLGWWAAFQLLLDKLLLLQDPTADLNCNFSLVVQCGENLNSWQGEVFGFPNPFIGLGGFVAPIAVGVAMLAGARFARWFWIAFAVGVAGALAFCIWLMSQSLFVIGTLCPWCVLVWAVTILLFWTLWLRILSDGTIPLPEGARRVFEKLNGYVAVITVLSYVIVALVAQVALEWLTRLVQTGMI